MPVEGIGGVFFRAKDPKGLAKWYLTHLGVGAPGHGDNPYEWMTKAGPVVFSPFAADTDYFPADKAYMVNFRVSGLDDLLKSLRDAGIEVITKAEWDEPGYGRFGRLHDPEGNVIELWEPPAD